MKCARSGKTNESVSRVAIESQIRLLGGHNILFDRSSVALVTDTLFDPAVLLANKFLTGCATGRGEAYFFRLGDRHLVLRHFRRGGLVGKIIRDHYVFRSLEASRSWREWRLLAELWRQGLPVPRPVAASVQRGGLFYRADLVTELIPDAKTLAEVLKGEQLAQQFWRLIGQCLRAFHNAGVFHADLNASNILLGQERKIFLIDFDRGSIRADGGWKHRNLERLKRSLLKFQRHENRFHFSADDWDLLLEGYTQ